MKRVIVLVTGVLLLLAGFLAGFAVIRNTNNQSVVAFLSEGTYAVARVLDGDTIELASGERVRYLGINAPENGAKWSTQAYELNRDLVENKSVRLEFDRVTRDPYGRILAYVWVGNTLINEMLIQEGFSRYYAVKGEAVLKYRDRLLAAETEAKEGHRGIWVDAWEAEKRPY